MMEIDKTESNLDEPSAAMNDHSGYGQSAVDDKDIQVEQQQVEATGA